MGVALEKVARAANGTYSSSDYTNIVRRNDDEGSTDEGIRLDKSVFALAAASFGPVVVGTRAYVGGEPLDSDTLVLRDETVGLEDLGRHYSASALEGVVACVHEGKLYVAAIPTDESVNYHLRVQPLECMVRFVNDDGTELQSGHVAYGDTPAYAGTTPRKKET
jgi:hypothetical protein